MPTSAPQPNDAATRFPAAAAVSAARGSNHTNSSPRIAIEIVTDTQRYARNPMMIPVKMPRRSTLRTSPSTVPCAMLRVAPRHDVAADAAVGGHDHASGQRDDVAADAPGDVRVAVHDDDAARDPAADEEVAVTDDHVVGDRAGDVDGAVERGDRTVDHLTARDVDVAADADAAIALGSAPIRRERGARAHREHDERERDDGDNVTTHAAPSGTGARSLARCRRRVQRPAPRSGGGARPELDRRGVALARRVDPLDPHLVVRRVLHHRVGELRCRR